MDSATHDSGDLVTLDPPRVSEVALLDRTGVIVAVNAAWEEFCLSNGGTLRTAGVGCSYLDACAAAGEDPATRQVAAAIRAALRGELPGPVTVEVPCHAPEESRWFDVLVSSRYDDDGLCLGATVVLVPRQNRAIRAGQSFAVDTDSELAGAAAAFGRYALASSGVRATIERAVDVVAAALDVPVAAVLQVLGPSRVAVLHSVGPVVRDSWDGGDAARPSLSVSVPVSGRPWGRLVVSHMQPRRFRGPDVDFLVAVAHTLGAALHRERADAARAAIAALSRFAVECADSAAMIERAVDVSAHVLDAPMGILARLSPEPGRLELVQVHGPLGLLPGASCSVDPELARAQARPEPLAVEDWSTESRFPLPAAGSAAQAASSLGVRVLVEGRPWGRLAVLDHRPRAFSAAEAEQLEEVAALLTAVLDRAQDQARRHQVTAAVRRALIPAELPAVQGVEITARCATATGADVGGDWYDVVRLPQGHVGLIVGDVEGHDGEAAALMGQVRAVIRAYAHEGHAPAEVMAHTNRYLLQHADRFVTCFYAELDPATRVVRHVAAGHPAPLVLATDGWAIPLPSTPSLALGVSPEAEFTERGALLPADGALLLVTDGLVGSFEEAAGDPGAEAFVHTARQHAAANLDDLADALAAPSLAAHPLRDDATLLAVRLTTLTRPTSP